MWHAAWKLSRNPGRKWFDCAECHAETEDHPLLKATEMTFICKNVEEFEESDEYCPNCDNHFVLEAKTPQAALKVESADTRMDARMLKDDRLMQEEERTIFDVKEAPNKLG